MLILRACPTCWCFGGTYGNGSPSVEVSYAGTAADVESERTGADGNVNAGVDVDVDGMRQVAA